MLFKTNIVNRDLNHMEFASARAEALSVAKGWTFALPRVAAIK